MVLLPVGSAAVWRWWMEIHQFLQSDFTDICPSSDQTHFSTRKAHISASLRHSHLAMFSDCPDLWRFAEPVPVSHKIGKVGRWGACRRRLRYTYFTQLKALAPHSIKAGHMSLWLLLIFKLDHTLSSNSLPSTLLDTDPSEFYSWPPATPLCYYVPGIQLIISQSLASVLHAYHFQFHLTIVLCIFSVLRSCTACHLTSTLPPYTHCTSFIYHYIPSPNTVLHFQFYLLPILIIVLA